MTAEQSIAVAEDMLRPCVHLCLRQGIDYRLLVDLLKGVYVSVAESDLAHANRKQTDSSISLLTGVHRKDGGT